MSRLWMITFQIHDWSTSSCTCATYSKLYICKHIVGLAVKLKVFEFLPEAKNVPLGAKRKRGRPALTKKALLIQ